MQIVHVFLLFLFLCLKREFLIVALSTVNVSVRFVLLVLAQLCSDLGESSALWARSSCSARSAGCCAFLLMGCLELSGEGVNTSYYYENKATVWFCHGNVLTWRWIQASLKSPAGSGKRVCGSGPAGEQAQCPASGAAWLKAGRCWAGCGRAAGTSLSGQEVGGLCGSSPQ